MLQVWRTFKLAPSGEDIRFLADCWPAAVEALRYLKTFDVNNDGLPDNGGAPDQTFDDWPCLLYTSPSPRDRQKSRMPSSA